MQISILGCGWLGLPLAQILLERGHSVKGSTTSQDKLPLLQKYGIAPYRIAFTPAINPDYAPEFFDSEILLVNFPPARQEDITAYYPQQMKALLRTIKGTAVQKILFVSSTSVYPNVNREVNEEDAGGEVKDSGQALLVVEKMLQENHSLMTTIVRFCGLFGPERNPGRFLAGKQVSGGQQPVNLIHLDDCMSILVKILEREVWGETFNACADAHPTKADFYGKAARKLSFEPPTFKETDEPSFKIVNSQKLKDTLGYQFKYTDPLDAL